jgi:hypothetical protein
VWTKARLAVKVLRRLPARECVSSSARPCGLPFRAIIDPLVMDVTPATPARGRPTADCAGGSRAKNPTALVSLCFRELHAFGRADLNNLQLLWETLLRGLVFCHTALALECRAGIKVGARIGRCWLDACHEGWDADGAPGGWIQKDESHVLGPLACK